MKELESQLGSFERQGLIKIWHDRKVIAGTDWKQEVNTHLKSANIILLLVSPAFMGSAYAHDVEMKLAMERYNAGEAHVIPIILRPVYYGGASFEGLGVLPTNRKALTSWSDRDEAYFDITEGIRQVVEGLRTASENNASSLSRSGDSSPHKEKLM